MRLFGVLLQFILCILACPALLAQNDFLLLAALLPGFTLPVTGAFNLLPVARLYFALPFAVSPPPCLTERFSPRPTDRFTDFFLRLATAELYSLVQCFFITPGPTLSEMLKGL